MPEETKVEGVEEIPTMSEEVTHSADTAEESAPVAEEVMSEDHTEAAA